MNPKIENLIKLFSKLPRVGGRAARRIVLSLLQDKTGKMQYIYVQIVEWLQILIIIYVIIV